MQSYNIFNVLQSYFSENRIFSSPHLPFFLAVVFLIFIIILLVNVPDYLRKNADGEFAEFVIKRHGINDDEEEYLLEVAQKLGIEPFYKILIDRRNYSDAVEKYLARGKPTISDLNTEQTAQSFEIIRLKLFGDKDERKRS